MKFLTIEQIQAQLRLSDEQLALEQTLLEMYASSSEDAILNLCRTTYEEVLEEYTTVPKPIVNAALLLVDHFYQNRSVVSLQNLSIIPYSFDFLVKPYMKLT